MGLELLVAAALDAAAEVDFSDHRVDAEDRDANAAICILSPVGLHQNHSAYYVADALDSMLQFWAHLRCLGGSSEVAEVEVAEAQEGSEFGLDSLGVRLESTSAWVHRTQDRKQQAAEIEGRQSLLPRNEKQEVYIHGRRADSAVGLLLAKIEKLLALFKSLGIFWKPNTYRQWWLWYRLRNTRVFLTLFDAPY